MEKEIKKYKALFQPITIGKVEIKNRIAMAPLATHQTTPDGYVTEQVKAWFAARAKGGTGLIISSPAHAERKHLPHHGILHLSDWSHKIGMSELAETVHAFGAKMFVQITAGGGRQFNTPSPSAIPIEILPDMLPDKARKEHEKRGLPYFGILEHTRGVIPPVLSIDEIVELEYCVANAVLLARQCGFDGVEFHCGHGQLGHQFFSPRTNKRNDLYGGSLENRMRYLRNMLNKARGKVGRDYCIGVRISGEEHMPEGLTHEEVRKICEQMEEMLDFVHLTDGCYEALKYMEPDEDGTMLKYAESLKKTLRIPVITPSIHDPGTAAQAVENGKTDMVSLGRPLIADPDWANKVAAGKHPIKCIRCNIGCLHKVAESVPIRCEVNPRTGLEQYIPEYRRSEPFKKYWVVGK